jgi:hypothetical protein
MHFVTIDRARPDFRVFIDLLHGPDWNVDTDGDSQPVNSRTWTYLYVADRTGAEPPVTIVATDEDANVFQVECTSARLEELAALYLFVRSGSDMTGDRGRLNDDEISSLQAKYLKELARATDARWHRSSDQDPYPKAG